MLCAPKVQKKYPQQFPESLGRLLLPLVARWTAEAVMELVASAGRGSLTDVSEEQKSYFPLSSSSSFLFHHPFCFLIY